MAEARRLTIDQAIDFAQKEVNRGNVSKAIQLYQAVLQYQPNHSVAKDGLKTLQEKLAGNQSVQVTSKNCSQDELNTLINLYQSGQMVKVEKCSRELLHAFKQSSSFLNTPTRLSIFSCISSRITDTFSVFFSFPSKLLKILFSSDNNKELTSISFDLFLLFVACSAALLPVYAPNTKHSVNELDPKRLAPLRLMQALSPAENNPLTEVLPVISTLIPPME